MHDDRRLEDVEIKLAHVERGLQELSDVVVRQQQEIDALQRANKRLAEQLATGVNDPDAATRVEIPPHY
jgi:SlyX protein